LNCIGYFIDKQLLQRLTNNNIKSRGKESALVNGAWLEQRLGKVKVFDATWFLTAAHGNRNADLEYVEKRIPTALRFDIDALADPSEKDLPHMLPPLDWFGLRMDEMGVAPTDQIVVYDAIGQFSSARAFWTLYVLGGHDVRLLDGGLPVWIDEKRPVESGSPTQKPKPNKQGTWKSLAKPRLDQVISMKKVEEFAAKAVGSGKPPAGLQMVDARPKNRFLGIDPEPRPGLKKGKIPGSSSVPFKELLNADGKFKDVSSIKKVFEEAGIDTSGKSTVMTSCGSGTTAAILSFALQELLGVNAPLYDGSFAEWGKLNASRPVV
jgi:thiosulfate/3-mercaptopyruvate sulfurtransferase